MRFAKCLFFGSVILVGGANTAWGDEIQLVKTADLTARIYDGDSIDILGIKIGMTPDQVRTIIATEYGVPPVEEQTSISITYKSITVTTQSYLDTLKAQKPGNADQISVSFGNPATGNTVVGVSRHLVFADPLTAPKITALYAQLDAKYGPESVPKPISFSPDLFVVKWAFNASGHIKCPFDLCITANDTYAPGNMTEYQRTVATGQHVVVQAGLFPYATDSSRASRLEIAIDDQASKARSSQEALTQLQAAGEKAYATAKPQEAPKL